MTVRDYKEEVRLTSRWYRAVFLKRRALASIIPGRERFSWNLSFWFSMHFSWINIL